MTRVWRHWGQLVDGDGAMHPVTFETPDFTIAAPGEPGAESEREFASRMRGLANLGATRGRMTAYANTYRVDVSEDGGLTWRTAYQRESPFAIDYPLAGVPSYPSPPR